MQIKEIKSLQLISANGLEETNEIGEKKLIREILFQAIRDFCVTPRASMYRNGKIAKDTRGFRIKDVKLRAQLWLTSRSNAPFSFNYICEHLGYCAEDIRAAIMTMGECEVKGIHIVRKRA